MSHSKLICLDGGRQDVKDGKEETWIGNQIHGQNLVEDRIFTSLSKLIPNMIDHKELKESLIEASKKRK